METEIKDPRLLTDGDDAREAHPRQATPMRRAGKIGLDILNPLSDFGVIYRTGLKPTLTRLRELREAAQRSAKPGEALNWTQAVAKSGRTVEQLLKTFRRIRVFWWCAMMITFGLSVILSAMLVAADFNIMTGTFARAVLTAVILVSLSVASSAKVLAVNFRLWQLTSQRVSIEENGTFMDYRKEHNPARHLLSPTSPF